jgi:hypothetical protein
LMMPVRASYSKRHKIRAIQCKNARQLAGIEPLAQRFAAY